MDKWHKPQCKKPDIAICSGLNVPTCKNCGEICPSHRADNKRNDELQIPSAGRRSAMQLKWPPSMSYQNYAYSDDPDGLLHKSLASLVDQEWCDKETDKHSSCSSVIKTAQTPSLQASQTSYEPLDGTKIRILRLHKGRFGDCLHGDFETVSLQNRDTESDEPETTTSDTRENATLYEAVSYTWAKWNGKREKDHAIFIGNRWDILPITENCYDALQNCRFDDRDRHLWVDAICINQSNISERTHQVGMMKRIYSTAGGVLIYLGTENITDDPEILSGNSYFSRIWVVQEIASAKQALVLYDRKAMHWDFFHGNLQHLSFERWMRHFGSPRQIDDAHGFLTLLGDTRNCNASDPRDKIFALLGLWEKPIEPDYTLSPQAVYTGLASILITDKSWEAAAQLLDMASHGRSMPGLPSWVPDWSEKSQRSYPKWGSHFPLGSLLDSESNDAEEFRVHGQTGSLCVLAAEIDIMAPYICRGFQSIADGMVTVEVGCFQVSLAPEVLQKCEPTDGIFRLPQGTFCLILRKKADPNVYNFVGLCKYSRSWINEQELDAIRYLPAWAWLLSLGQKEPWLKVSTWTSIQVCWLALRKQKKLETRLFLQRLVKKAQFLEKMRILAQEAQLALSNCSRDKELLKEFFQRQWEKTYKRWRQEDEQIVVDHQARRALIRKLLPGYRSLEPVTEITAQSPLGQAMWLPISLGWFGRKSKLEGPLDLPLLVACVSRNIPLPPLHLVTDDKRHITLCLELGLEKGVRQLQRLVREHFPKKLPVHERLVSYNLQTSFQLYGRERKWAIFLHLLSKPIPPDYDMLKCGSRIDVPSIWEMGLVLQTQLGENHTWLDDNFDRHTGIPPSWSLPSMDKFFELLYLEHFELLWRLICRSYLTYMKGSHRVTLNGSGFWMFEHSIKEACKNIGIFLVDHQMNEDQWNRFLGWLRQQPFVDPVWNIPSKVSDSWPRKQEEEAEAPESRQASPEDTNSYACLLPRTLRGEQRLSQLIHSEIYLRRLPERVFAFLFDDAGATPQPAKSKCTALEGLLAHDQLSAFGEPLTQHWRQETESWRVLEKSKRDGELPKEIVII
ncbi:heterokaryon incompatibility het-6 [Fusarium mundagurra]|uniref:Heterokaryon incompatibility het-6 n=1 Tax=Fusarium mundagurra TaxID=1567541 RepID=A0A8H5Y1T0_9HYPO|nr:heterokaryon incompatibility het-6 [Fusarium mundagurra]